MNKGLSKRVLSPLKRTASGSISSIESLPPKTEAPEKLRTYKDFINRTIFTIAMAYVFLVLISLGVEVVIPLVIAIECTMFYEITRINQRARKDRQLVSMFVLKLWFLGSTIFLVTSHSIREPLVATSPWLLRYYANFGMFAFGL
ncbi:CDP-diacylglycerol synthetase, putative, partial [Trypanosoma cruzi]